MITTDVSAFMAGLNQRSQAEFVIKALEALDRARGTPPPPGTPTPPGVSGLASLPEGWLDNGTIEMGGRHYRLADVVGAVANAPQAKETQFLFERGVPSEISYVLADDTRISLGVTSEEEEATGHTVFTAHTDNWKGLGASFEIELRPVTQERTVAGVKIAFTHWELVRKTDLVFDLTNGLEIVIETEADAS